MNEESSHSIARQERIKVARCSSLLKNKSKKKKRRTSKPKTSPVTYVGNFFKSLRAKRGMTRKEVSEKVGLGLHFVALLEQGGYIGNNIERFFMFYKVPVEKQESILCRFVHESFHANGNESRGRLILAFQDAIQSMDVKTTKKLTAMIKDLVKK